MTNSENPGLHVYRSYLDGVDWRDWVHLEKRIPAVVNPSGAAGGANGAVIPTRVSG